ncbi:MAG TPA: hypothetical protein VFO19_13385 [Vicinamibacterales bacterium]|nr:hypothetical protein [Vicinamibacterales bacterium]
MPSSSEAIRPAARRATAVGAFLEGWRRVLGAPSLTLGVLALTFLLALPLAIALGGMIEDHLGRSRQAERAAWNWNSEWAGEFAASAQGLGPTLTEEIVGFSGTVSTVSRFLDREPLNPTIAGAVAAYLLLWIFLSGGILDRLARGRPIGLAAFSAACGVHFFRFLRLGLIVGPAYLVILEGLHPWLFGPLYDRFTRDNDSEFDAIVIRAALYLVFLGALAVVNVVADFARVRAVVEDRRSMLATVGASLRFIRRRPMRVAGLYLLNVIAFLAIVRLWYSLAPSAWAPVWLAFLSAQIYLLLRVWARLSFIASEIVFFQGELAHAGYTAAPPARWPDSPAVEALATLTADAVRERPSNLL